MPRPQLDPEDRRVNVVPVSMTDAQYARLLSVSEALAGRPLATILYNELAIATSDFTNFPATGVSIHADREE